MFLFGYVSLTLFFSYCDASSESLLFAGELMLTNTCSHPHRLQLSSLLKSHLVLIVFWLLLLLPFSWPHKPTAVLAVLVPAAHCSGGKENCHDVNVNFGKCFGYIGKTSISLLNRQKLSKSQGLSQRRVKGICRSLLCPKVQEKVG